MGYVITAGVGLAVGLSLLVWAVRLRGKLADAVAAKNLAVSQRDEFKRIADANTEVAKDAEATVSRLNVTITDLRNRLAQARRRLVESRDPQVIKKVLDEELKEETI